jgi:hypothetical protein
MKTYKGIIIQNVKNGYGDYVSDGVYDFTINAENEYKATCKMLDYFYENYWYCGEEDMNIEKFKKLSEYAKFEALSEMKCLFEYIVYYNEENTETVKISI